MPVIDHFAHLITGPEIPLREVLRRIDAASPHLFQVIVDADRRVLGTITDGDIRRAMVGGATLDDQARKCMNTAPKIIQADRPADAKLRSQGITFLPLVDPDGRLCGILVNPRRDVSFHRALVLAGGFGTRLGKLTESTPKPLLQVGDKPMLERVLAHLEAAGVDDIYIATHYLAEQIVDFIAQRNGRARIRVIHEAVPLGTAGAMGLLPSEPAMPTLVVNGDVLTNVDLQAMLTFHDRHGYDGTIAVKRYDVSVPFGVVHHSPDGLFAGIEEKPNIGLFVAAGIYLLSQEFAALVPGGKSMQMPDLLNLGQRAGLRIGVFPMHESWIDVGRPEDLHRARSSAGAQGD